MPRSRQRGEVQKTFFLLSGLRDYRAVADETSSTMLRIPHSIRWASSCVDGGRDTGLLKPHNSAIEKPFAHTLVNSSMASCASASPGGLIPVAIAGRRRQTRPMQRILQ